MPTFNDTASVHHSYIIGEARDQMQIVRHQKNCHAPLRLQLAKQSQDLLLDRDIQRTGWLVGKQNLWVLRERECDDDALFHAAGKFMRVHVEATLGIRNFYVAQKFNAAAAKRSGIKRRVCGTDGFAQLCANRQHRI